MDPNDLQNNLNLGSHGQQNSNLNAQGQPQYNPMLLQQQYMNNFGQFYGNNQVLGMDPFQQQQYLMMQTQQMQPMFQQPQQQTQAQVLQQHLLSQQQAAAAAQQQRFAQQQQQQQQQQALQSQQQRLLEEQQRQMELRRQEELARQRQKEAEELRRQQELQQELALQREKERLEQQRLQEEAARAAEEQRRREEAERIEKEKLLRIREEQLKKQRDSEQTQRDMMERMAQVANPLALVATHFINKYTTLLPFPSENLSTSKLPSVSSNDEETRDLLNCVDPTMVAMISNALSKVDVNDIRTRLDHHEGLAETNDLPLDQMPPLIKMVMQHNCNALDVEPEHHMGIADTEHLLNEMQDDLNGPAPSRTLAPTSSAGDSVQQPSTSTASTPAPEKVTPQVQIQLDSQDAIKLRRQMASVGKQPKAGGTQRKKRDMVECLYDSLTDYFDPSAGRRMRRLRGGRSKDNQEEDDAELQHDLELIARMEAGESVAGETDMDEVMRERAEGGSDEEENKFYDKKKKRKREEREMERPPTPTEVIHLREQEWNERQRKRMEKRRRRKGEDDVQDCWNNDVMAENDSFTRFNALVDQVLDQVEDMDVVMACKRKQRMETGEADDGDEEEEEDEVSQELLLERVLLDDLRNETQKLKSWKKLNKVSVDRLVKLVTVLERNMRDVISQDGTRLLVPIVLDEEGEEDDLALRELVDDRLVRAVDATCTALMIMTCHKMPKQVFMEDAIERSISLCKQYLNHIVFPASDSVFRSSNGNRKMKGDDVKRKRKAGTSNRSHAVQHIYARIADAIGCFSELVRIQQLPDHNVHQLATMSIASFFVSNVGELQLQAMCLASNIFSLHDDHVRVHCLNDILNSLHRLPPGKNTNNSYRMGAEQWISNTTVLVMQLIQSVVKVPKRRKNDDDDKKSDVSPDTVVKFSFKEAQRLSHLFLSGFLSKCSCKGNKSEGEEDYRRLFDGFLQDLLVALYKPEWPAAEMMLTILGTLLVKHYRTKTTDIVIRQASLDYLGSITARLRRDMRSVVGEDSDKRMQLVVKTLVFEEQEDSTYETVDDVDISQLSTTDRLKKLEQALIDYLVDKKGDDVGIEYAVKFYAGEWYKETAEDLDMAKQQFKENKRKEMTDKERRKLEKKMDRMNEKGAAMKEFLIKLVDKKCIRKRAETISRLGNVMMESDAAWAVKYLASRREFSHSFELYLRHILFGVSAETTVSLRTKAMRCLTQIIEADHEVLGMEDVRQAVNSRMMDPNAAVREATIELLGKFLLVKEEFIPTYYGILLERVKDSGTAVRKRVIRIMREICERYPNFEQIPDMLSKLVRRVVDEDGVKKLIQETFSALWFSPCQERGGAQLIRKVLQMTAVAQLCAADSTAEYLEQLLLALLKQSDKGMLLASRQIVDSLVDTVLELENKMATDASATPLNGEDLSSAQLQKSNQERLLASLTTLSMFSKVRPGLLVRHAETLQPYLSMTVSTPAEQQVLNEVISMLERIVPLMNHPSESFLQSLDDSLASLLMSSGMQIVVSVVGCAAAVWNNFPRKQTTMTQKYLYFLRNLNQIRMQYQSNPQFQPKPNLMPMLQRSVFSLGLLSRYFDFDTILENDKEAAERNLVPVTLPPNITTATAEIPEATADGEEKPVLRRYRDNVFVVLEFFSHSSNQAIRQKALTSIGHLCAKYAEYLARMEVKSMYMAVLAATEPHYLQLKIQALKNLELFLLAEEKKMIKSNDDWEKAKEQQNLKEMELAGSGLSSAIIQIYWVSVLNCYFHPSEVVRQTAVQVTWLTLSQGLVTPGSSIPTLIAMITDPVPAIRNKVENLLKEIDTKYAGMVQSKAIAGIRIAYRLHTMIGGGTKGGGGTEVVVRGIRACDASLTAMTPKVSKDPFGLPRHTNDGQAILSGLYSSLRGNRSHRRSFMNSVLRLFSEDSREKLHLSEWIFVADNVAMFPYQVLDEPLYAIRHIDGIISLSGQSIVNQFKDHLLPVVGGPPARGGETQTSEDDDLIFEPETIFRRFPEDKRALYELMLNSQACFILLYLKNFLIKLYGFTEAKVQEYSPSEAAKVYEKAVTRRNIHMFHPQSALEELRPEVIEERNSLQGHYKLAHKICSFRKMLLSLDRMEEEEGDEIEEGVTGGVTERDSDDDVDGETTEGAEPDSEGPMAMEQ